MNNSLLFELNESESILFYLAVFIMAALFASLADKFSKPKETLFLSRFFLLVSFFIAWIPLAFRYYVGTDYGNYKLYYQHISDGLFEVGINVEPGYWLINIIASMFDFDYQFIIAVTSFITILVFYIGLSFYSKKINIGIATFLFLILYYPFICNCIRQGMAMAFAFLSYKYIAERKIKKYLLAILSGSLFHYTILFLIPLYFATGNTKINRRLNVILIMGLSVILYNVESIAQLFVNSFDLFGKYEFYTPHAAQFGLGIFFYIAIYAFFFILLNRNDNENAVLMDILFLGFIFAYIGTAFYAGGRLFFYFNMTYIILLLKVANVLDKRLRIVYFYILVISAISLWYYDTVINGFMEILPYAATSTLF